MAGGGGGVAGCGRAARGGRAPGFGVVAYEVMVDASRPLFAMGFGLIVAATISRPAVARTAA